MYSFENFNKYGFQKTLFSIPTLIFALTGLINQVPNIYGLIIFFLYLIIGSYTKFFDYLKSNQLPTPRLYNTKIPTFLFQMLSYYIVYSFIVSIYFNFIK